MTSSRLDSMAPGRLGDLLGTAAREFAGSGYEGASLNRIIRSCGMSKSSFYHYFENKRELFEVVVARLGESLVAELSVPSPASFARSGFWPGLTSLAHRFATLAAREPTFADLGRMCYLPGAPPEAVASTMAVVETWLHELLAVGRESGAVRRDLPADLQARMTVAVVRAFDEWTLAQPGLAPDELPRLVDAQLGALRRLLAAD